MGRIRQLSSELINKIAAGEVVERPASVIKELIENSIDAESTEIIIELVDAGKKSIIIRDNGTGIDEDDIEVALERHATSKLNTSEDLFAITTLGFRGEALPAIAGVSKLSIISKTHDKNYGIKIITEYGKIVSKNKKAINNGTTITIEDLFENIPARKKFLKKTPTELSHCIAIINNFAISYPGITFKLIHNGRSLFFYPSTKKTEDRLSTIINTNAKWLTACGSYEYISGEVYLIPPSFDTRKDFRIFINGRNFRDRVLSHAISNSFNQILSSEHDTTVIIFLDIDPAFVDVNVSPSKNEVRFREQNFVYSFVQNIIEQALYSNKNTKSTRNITISNYENPDKKDFHGSSLSKEQQKEMQLFYTTTKDLKDMTSQKNSPDIEINGGFYRHYVIGQFKYQYILIEEGDKLIIIDQHAAHERINYEKLIKSLIEDKEVQQFLVPLEFTLSKENSVFIKQIFDQLSRLGIKISEEKNKQDSFSLHSVPKLLEKIDPVGIIKELAGLQLEDISKQSIHKSISLIAARKSCHSSIRGPRKLSEQEIEKLLQDLSECNYPYTCPHGRPVRIEISLNDIEKMFMRK